MSDVRCVTAASAAVTQTDTMNYVGGDAHIAPLNRQQSCGTMWASSPTNDYIILYKRGKDHEIDLQQFRI